MLISNLVQSQNDTIVLIFTLLPCMVMLGWGNEKERGENGEAYEWSNGRKDLRKQLANYDKDKQALINAKARLKVINFVMA